MCVCALRPRLHALARLFFSGIRTCSQRCRAQWKYINLCRWQLCARDEFCCHCPRTAAAAAREKRATGDARMASREEEHEILLRAARFWKYKKRLCCRFWYTKCIGERWGNNNVDTRMNYPPLQPCSDVGKRSERVSKEARPLSPYELGGIDQEGIFHILQCPLLFIMLVRGRARGPIVALIAAAWLAWDMFCVRQWFSFRVLRDAVSNIISGLKAFWMKYLSRLVDGNPLKLWHIFE